MTEESRSSAAIVATLEVLMTGTTRATSGMPVTAAESARSARSTWTVRTRSEDCKTVALAG